MINLKTGSDSYWYWQCVGFVFLPRSRGGAARRL